MANTATQSAVPRTGLYSECALRGAGAINRSPLVAEPVLDHLYALLRCMRCRRRGTQPPGGLSAERHGR
eukprot:CAMPEP_0179116532 /NCGR_PEP_ID=MMETSP0796-20121207/54674_1 /TAXON_ID=73915 /ORGANISM="Pyrodinium bahamense, Strain pbaha01" /LENGTH=68 /DNA_ID=CAMNT_0020814837 /DNA_START=63 /DNA_END=266 /DNA_ORIENTATION=+